MNYLDKANSLRAFLAQNSLPKLKRKRFGQDGLEEKKDPYADYGWEWITKADYDKLSPEEKISRFRKKTPPEGYRSDYIGELRETDTEYKAKKKQEEQHLLEDKKYIQEQKNKKLSLPSPTDAQLRDLNTYVSFLREKTNFEDPRYVLYRKKGLDILENTNVLPIENVKFPGMFKTSLDYSSTKIPTWEELDIERGKYCPGCFYFWENNEYPKPTPPKKTTSQPSTDTPWRFLLGNDSYQTFDEETAKTFAKDLGITNLQRGDNKNIDPVTEKYRDYSSLVTPVTTNIGTTGTITKYPKLKRMEYGGTIYKKKSKLKQTYLNKYK